MKKILSILGLAVVLLMSSPAFSLITCTGKVEAWKVTKAGYLYVNGTWNGDDAMQRVCNVSTTWDSIKLDTCHAMKDVIALAATLDREIEVTYYTATSCLTAALNSGSSTTEGPGDVGMGIEWIW